MKINDDELIKLLLVEKYESENENLDDIIRNYNEVFLREYKKRFPGHFISQYYIKAFLSELSNIKLLPDKEKYVFLHQNNEFFEISISLFFEKRESSMLWQFPYPINIHKVTEYIQKRELPSVSLCVPTLQRMINPECFDEFDMDMQAKAEGRDFLDEKKADNPIIVLYPEGIVDKKYLINGTHRTIQAIRDQVDTIEGYIVYPEVCRKCGMTENYELLYGKMYDLYKKIYGVSRKIK